MFGTEGVFAAMPAYSVNVTRTIKHTQVTVLMVIADTEEDALDFGPKYIEKCWDEGTIDQVTPWADQGEPEQSFAYDVDLVF